MLAPAVERLGVAADPANPAYLQKLEFEAIKLTLSHLRSFPMIQVLERRGYLHLHAAYFGVADGRLLALDEETGEFRQVEGGAHAAAFEESRF
jgi:carbonic anhydrase